MPYLGIRAISDCADESLDPKILKFIDPFGNPRIGDVIGEFFKHPSIVGRLRQLSKDSAAPRLGLFCVKVWSPAVDRPPPVP